MNLREAAELAMWTLESTGTDPSDPKQAIQYNRELRTIERLRQALAQPEQEPVCFLRETSWSYEIAPWDDPNGIPVYTAPPSIEAAVLAEREACAKVVEQYCGAWDDEGYALAQAIRANRSLATTGVGKPNYCTPQVTPQVTPEVTGDVDETAKGKQEKNT